jgi:hypothetical protein
MACIKRWQNTRNEILNKEEDLDEETPVFCINICFGILVGHNLTWDGTQIMGLPVSQLFFADLNLPPPVKSAKMLHHRQALPISNTWKS